MKRFGVLAWAVGCALLGMSAVAAPVAEPEAVPVPEPPQAGAAPAELPHIVFEKTELDLGEIVHGKDATAVFIYRNTGKVPLHILSAKPG
jgi:hypothetical protein